VTGVVLQNSNRGYGFFVGSSQTGSCTTTPH
jgi:hypothetical protein